jgi:hypothetical protein
LSVEGDLVAFVRATIPTVWTLELLLLLRQDPAQGWQEDDLVRELRASQTLVSNSLASLAASALIVRSDQDGWRYSPAELLDALCQQLHDAYRSRPVAIISMISKPDPIQLLADAFKIRGGG